MSLYFSKTLTLSWNVFARELTEKLSIDYGTEKEFLFLGSLCFQLKVDE